MQRADPVGDVWLRVLRGEAAMDSTLEHKLEYLNRIGTALSSEPDIDVLLEQILVAAQSLTGADGGTVYLLNEANDSLCFAIMRNASLNIAHGGKGREPPPFPELPLHHPDGSENRSLVAVHAALTGETVNIPDAYTEPGFDFSGTRRFDEMTGGRSQSFLTVPLKNHERQVIGVLQLLNALDPETGAVVPFSEQSQCLVESLGSQAAVALTNRRLIEQLAALFEAFIGMINAAIDEKSPHTGHHCQRVPELTMMIAEAIHEADYGPLADFHLTEADRYELRIAGLLHDCGKVTTPVHVVDKATKLQTIHDRIELVDTRFEVVRRDARIRCLEAMAAGIPREQAESELADALARIDADQTFLRRANIGSERMQGEDQERVRAIAQAYRWQPREGSPAEDFLTPDEVENLCITAGTLTQDEREIINQHIVTTINMLEALPWPRHLRRVPEYAGGHHERMDGKGYPRGLTREQMSVQARLMGIADIFEALTASDRPYKKPMSLSVAMGILSRFSANGHVDPDIFEIFTRAGVWRKYGEAFLDANQIDDVDVEQVLQQARAQ